MNRLEPQRLEPQLFPFADRALDEILGQQRHASRVLAQLFAAQTFSRQQRAALAHAVYTVLRNLRRIRRVSEIATLSQAFEPGLADPVQDLALRTSLPDWLAARLLADYGPRAEHLAQALTLAPPVTIRVNQLKTTPQRLILDRPALPCRWSSNGLILEAPDVFDLPAFEAGHFELQDEGSQLIAEIVAPPPQGSVLDACAGAGGKTLAIAAALGGKGRIIATELESHPEKLNELKRRARRAGAHNVQTRAIAAQGPLPDLPRFDRVLVDAPCSGTGVLRRNPEAKWHLSPERVDRLPALQSAILDRFAPQVAPKGRLIYATCSLLRSENEAVVEAFLARASDFKVMPIKEIWGRDRAERLGDGTFLKVAPDTHGTDGFFAAVLRRVPNQ